VKYELALNEVEWETDFTIFVIYGGICYMADCFGTQSVLSWVVNQPRIVDPQLIHNWDKYWYTTSTINDKRDNTDDGNDDDSSLKCVSFLFASVLLSGLSDGSSSRSIIVGMRPYSHRGAFLSLSLSISTHQR